MAKKKEKEEQPEEEAQSGAAAEKNGTGNESDPEIMVAYTMEEVDAMKDELEVARADSQKHLDSFQRALADYNNLKRRTEQEREQMSKEAVGKVIVPFIDVMEDLEMAIKNKPQDEASRAWGEGIELVYRKLVSKLETQGVRAMQPQGQPFDPRFHEAISQEPSDEVESGCVIEMVKAGYLIGERVLRPALVRVAA